MTETHKRRLYGMLDQGNSTHSREVIIEVEGTPDDEWEDLSALWDEKLDRLVRELDGGPS